MIHDKNKPLLLTAFQSPFFSQLSAPTADSALMLYRFSPPGEKVFV